MCITAPAQVVDLDEQGAVVVLDGRRRRASTAVVTDVAVGEWVIVGAGTILRRLEPELATELLRTIESATASADRRATHAGGKR